MTELSPEELLREYESQLADVNTLIELTPEDESILALKTDLLELIAITRSTLTETDGPSTVPDASQTRVLATHDSREVGPIHTDYGQDEGAPDARDNNPYSQSTHRSSSVANIIAGDHHQEPPVKKAKRILKDFEVPSHLIVLDADTEAEANKKRRALKAIKSKWRERKKEAESEEKQKSWQSFQKKKKTTSNMFGTAEGDTRSKVGVVLSGSHLKTEEQDRRHIRS